MNQENHGWKYDMREEMGKAGQNQNKSGGERTQGIYLELEPICYKKESPFPLSEPEEAALLPAQHTGHLNPCPLPCAPLTGPPRGTWGSGGRGRGVRCHKEEDGRKSRTESKAGQILSLVMKAWLFHFPTTCCINETLTMKHHAVPGTHFMLKGKQT